jgi:hypothetical protein
MSDRTFYYFAYGSNLKLSEMQRSCPTAKRKFRVRLQDYALAFPRKSKGRQCGVAGIEARGGCEVWGGVYEIPEADRGNLETREGYKRNRPLIANSYVPTDLTALVDGDPARPVQVMTFLANAEANPPLPNHDYKSLIIAGAQEWNLKAKYIAQLEQIVTTKS